MTQNKRFHLCLAALMFCLNALAQISNTDQIRFSNISLNDGLSQSTVFSIAQDNVGHMWFATYDGVNKYDGYNFIVYQHDSSDPTTIANNVTRAVFKDTMGRIWVGTRDGLSFYNEEKDIFQNFFYIINNNKTAVNNIIELDPEHLLLGTKAGILVFDITVGDFSAEMFDPKLHALQATTMNRQGDNIYIGTNEGLFVYSVKEKLLYELAKDLERLRIQAVLQQSPSRLWVATEGAGLYLLNPKTGELKNYRHNAADPKSISSNYIRSLAIDGRNRLWIGTFNDLNIYHEGTDSFASYTSNPVDPESLSQNSVRSLFMDTQGGMWLGTYFGGLNYYHPLKNRFTNIRRIPYQNSLNDNVVNCITEDSKGNVWIGTNDGGLNLLHANSKRFTHYTVENQPGKVNSNNIKSIYVDESGARVYFGTHAGGVSVINLNTGNIAQHFNKRNSTLVSDDVYAIEPAEDNKLWFGTLISLMLYDPAQQKFVSITRERNGSELPIKTISTLYRDSQHRLWIGGEEGIQVYHSKNNELTNAGLTTLNDKLRNVFINCIHECRNGIYWIGTRDGVFSYNEKTHALKHFTTLSGLSNNVVYGIMEDSFGHLWMSTNKGLSCFNPETDKFRNFNQTDGIQSNQFNSAYCRAQDGSMYFGGIDGITAFRPELLIDNPYTPSVIITELRLFNKIVRPDDHTKLLKQNISQTKCLTFNAAQTSFSLDFVVSNYISGGHNTFAYKLSGYDKEWYYQTENQPVSYSNLPHGKYTFMVKAANNDGKWMETPTLLEIIVLPVWYKTWWAFLLFLLLGIAISFTIIRILSIRRNMRTKLELERKDKEHQEEINQMKMRFFINISHEFRTPLTLIMAPLQEIINRTSDRWTRGQLDYIQRNTNRLLYLVNQLMDYRRAELGVFALKVTKGDAHRLIEDNFLFFDKLAKQKKIHYTLQSEIEQRELLFDRNYLELIINNLLSNAFKYTREEESITVTAKEKDGCLVLQVADTGVGIPLDKQAKIFERFYQIEGEHLGSGIGLSLVQRLVELHHGCIEVDSEEGKGSTFTLYLPQSADQYADNELAKEENQQVEVHTTNPKDMHFLDAEGSDGEMSDTNDKKRGTILIVEDNNEIRQYLSQGLTSMFHILGAENGEVALELLKENDVDVVLTDVMMPVMDGIKLCKNIKQNIRTCHIPVIILSAKNEMEDQLEGLQMGADDYIPKPFVLAIVITKIQNMMRTRHRMIEKYTKSLEVEPEKITFNAMDEELLKRAMSVVEKNMDNIEFSTDEFARCMNMSRSNLHLKMKAITGESTIDFIRKIRFNEACRLLKDGRYTIAEVSSMVGFNTPSYFATSFKKYIGCLPTEYIKKQKG